MDLSTKQKQTHRLRERTMVAGEVGWGGMVEGRDSWGVWDGHVHTAVCKINSQQGPTVFHGEPCSMFMWQPGWEGCLSENGSMYMYG